MLRYKVRKTEFSSDAKGLEITNVERQESAGYDVPDGDFGTVISNDDKVTFKFWVKDLYSVQSGTGLTSVSDIVVDNDSGDSRSFKHVNYLQDVTVESASSVNNTFTVSINKEIPLDAERLCVETRYHAVFFFDGRWNMLLVDREWVDNKIEEYGEENVIRIKTSQAAYGRNSIESIDGNGVTVSNNTVFYYENSSWKTIDLSYDYLEGCLSGGSVDKIDFSTFHYHDEYNDVGGRDAIALDEDKAYYTRENYVMIDFSGTHYFGAPVEEHDILDDDEKPYVNTTDYGKSVIKSIAYPVLHMYMGKNDGGSTFQYKIDMECHADSSTRLAFNYDTIAGKATVIKENTSWTTNDDGLYTKATEEEESPIGDDLGMFIGNMFPYGITYASGDEEGKEDGDGECDPETCDIPFQEGYAGGFVFQRDNFMYDDYENSYSLTYYTPINTIQIPLAQKLETDLFHNDALGTNFVEAEKARMINDIADMEKDVYAPAIQKTSEGNEINSEYVDCYKIIFNLHFREHRDVMADGQTEEWKCDNDCYWNGTRVLADDDGNKIIDLKGRVYNYDLSYVDTTEAGKYDYFSYYAEEPENSGNDNNDGDNDYNPNGKSYCSSRESRNQLKEYQSDLLSYLGFSNDDVKYQKSKLKKSFLRISFYDSDNIGNQNLLHTSTIFLDAGGLYAKYIKNIDTEDEYVVKASFGDYKSGDILSSEEYNNLSSANKRNCNINGEPMAIIGTSLNEEDSYTVYNVSGVRVNREPMRKGAISVSNGDLGDDIDELERLRMSSQIVVEDKFSSSRSSEGFYFYNYRSNDNGVFPTEIYMRVEFNHAGYGRTIPFMMPYVRENEANDSSGRYGDGRKNRIKTFDDICHDWSEVECNNGNLSKKDEEDIGYSPAKYIKYCHVKWKYRYDKDTQKHIYYLDPGTYGTGVTYENGHGHNIILNLYEGKIN